MKASAVIFKLKEMIEAYGDLPVRFFEVDGDADIGSIIAYDEDGNRPDDSHPPCEIYLHSL